MIIDIQLTVTWHVNYLKVSNETKKDIDDFIEWAKVKYEDFTPVIPSCGKMHDYLAIKLNHKMSGAVKLLWMTTLTPYVLNFLTNTN